MGQLNGKEVDVFKGENIHRCTIESGYPSGYPFRARSSRSGTVHCQFTAATAKQLHEEGRAWNMELVN